MVAEAGNSLGTQRKGNVHHLKQLPRNGHEDMTVGTGVCMCMCAGKGVYVCVCVCV
jgi:hypothetical protein